MTAFQAYLIFLWIATAVSQFTDVTVTSDAGTFVGFSENVDLGDRNVTIEKFLGIPFAESPVLDLRFRKPVMKKPLKDPLKVQRFGSPCLGLQASFPVAGAERDSEDCLFLNIFRPDISGVHETLPVMVWIYGGGFVGGKSDHYIPDALVANGPVIVVTFNYRVSLWGFLSTEDSNAPGNYGLWDQHTALQWVHNNVAAFGGDPGSVTIFGQSAGAASVMFQGLYPGNKGFFQRIIAQSGTAAALWAVRPNPRSDAVKLAQLVDCETGDVKAMTDCLRSVPMEKLNSTLNDLTNWEFTMPMAFVPSVDNDFVSELPYDTLDVKSGSGKDLKELFSSFDLMIGLNSGEGGGTVHPGTGADTDAENFLPNKTLFAGKLVPFVTDMIFGKGAPAGMRDLVVAEYTDRADPENPINIRQQFCAMFSDAFLLANTHRTVKTHASLSGGKTYLYYFNVLLYKSFVSRPSWFFGAMHGDELALVFGNKIDMEIPGMIENRELQAWEKTAAGHVMTLWTNFAKTGSPNKPRYIGVDWLPYTPSRHYYLELSNDVTASKVKERLLEHRAELWDSLWPAIAKQAKCEKPDDPQGTCSREGDCPP